MHCLVTQYKIQKLVWWNSTGPSTSAVLSPHSHYHPHPTCTHMWTHTSLQPRGPFCCYSSLSSCFLGHGFCKNVLFVLEWSVQIACQINYSSISQDFPYTLSFNLSYIRTFTTFPIPIFFLMRIMSFMFESFINLESSWAHTSPGTSLHTAFRCLLNKQME